MIVDATPGRLCTQASAIAADVVWCTMAIRASSSRIAYARSSRNCVTCPPPRRLLASAPTRLPARAAAVRIALMEVAEELGRDDGAVAACAVASDQVADDLLGMPLRVDVGGVDEIAAAIHEARDDRFGL